MWGAAWGWGLWPPRTLLGTNPGVSLTGGHPEPCAGIPTGFVLRGRRVLTLRWGEDRAVALHAAFFSASHAGDPFHGSLIPICCSAPHQGTVPLLVHQWHRGCWAGSGGRQGRAGTGRSAARQQARGGLTAPPALADYSQDEKALLGACDCSQGECDAAGPCGSLLSPPHHRFC